MHAPLPIRAGSRVTLAGIAAAVTSFIVAWTQYGLTPETVGLGATAGGIIVAFFAGRSHQARGAIEAGVKSYEESLDDLPAADAPLPGEDQGDKGSA